MHVDLFVKLLTITVLSLGINQAVRALDHEPALTSTPAPQAASTVTVEDLWPADLLQISSTEAFSKYVLLVDKSERKLLIFERSGETIHRLLDVSADIGKTDGNKTKRDDQKTPEGIYILQKKQ